MYVHGSNKQIIMNHQSPSICSITSHYQQPSLNHLSTIMGMQGHVVTFMFHYFAIGCIELPVHQPPGTLGTLKMLKLARLGRIVRLLKFKIFQVGRLFARDCLANGRLMIDSELIQYMINHLVHQRLISEIHETFTFLFLR